MHPFRSFRPEMAVGEGKDSDRGAHRDTFFLIYLCLNSLDLSNKPQDW